MKVKAVGFGLKKTEQTLIKRMLMNIMEADEVEVIDIKSYRLNLTSGDIIVVYGTKAKKQVARMSTNEMSVITLPDVSVLEKPKNESETPARKKAVKSLREFKKEIDSGGKVKQTIATTIEQINSINILTKEGAKIMVSDKEQSIKSDMLTGELKSLLQLLHHPAFQEVKVEFSKSNTTDGSGGSSESSCPDDTTNS